MGCHSLLFQPFYHYDAIFILFLINSSAWKSHLFFAFELEKLIAKFFLKEMKLTFGFGIRFRSQFRLKLIPYNNRLSFNVFMLLWVTDAIKPFIFSLQCVPVSFVFCLSYKITWIKQFFFYSFPYLHFIHLFHSSCISFLFRGIKLIS